MFHRKLIVSPRRVRRHVTSRTEKRAVMSPVWTVTAIVGRPRTSNDSVDDGVRRCETCLFPPQRHRERRRDSQVRHGGCDEPPAAYGMSLAPTAPTQISAQRMLLCVRVWMRQMKKSWMGKPTRITDNGSSAISGVCRGGHHSAKSELRSASKTSRLGILIVFAVSSENTPQTRMRIQRRSRRGDLRIMLKNTPRSNGP
uniref:Uncharacterized protein n=1 Tax=Mycena chlorophos TaxID=658473 RepID=A0ABQ0LJ32_MYCCL|nr:predicted protein [Mycena chlorophos]